MENVNETSVVFIIFKVNKMNYTLFQSEWMQEKGHRLTETRTLIYTKVPNWTTQLPDSSIYLLLFICRLYKPDIFHNFFHLNFPSFNNAQQETHQEKVVSSIFKDKDEGILYGGKFHYHSSIQETWGWKN